MKVFISWSGELSHGVALILRDWLPSVIQAVEPYVSSEDIDKGARWFSDIAAELGDSSFGIVCLTRENMNAPWILFESGAISKSLERSRVTPLLIDLSPTDLEGPLVQFQATTISKPDMLKLVKTINAVSAEHKLSDNQVEKYFGKWWPDFETRVKEAINQFQQTAKRQRVRTDREVLEEVLQLSRTMAQLMTNLRDKPDIESSPIWVLGEGGTGKSSAMVNYLKALLLNEYLKPEEEQKPELNIGISRLEPKRAKERLKREGKSKEIINDKTD